MGGGLKGRKPPEHVYPCLYLLTGRAKLWGVLENHWISTPAMPTKIISRGDMLKTRSLNEIETLRASPLEETIKIRCQYGWQLDWYAQGVVAS